MWVMLPFARASLEHAAFALLLAEEARSRRSAKKGGGGQLCCRTSRAGGCVGCVAVPRPSKIFKASLEPLFLLSWAFATLQSLRPIV